MATVNTDDFGIKIPSSVELFTLDFKDLLKTGETITSATSEITLKSGDTDPDLGTMLVSFPVVSGTKISQMVQGGLAGNVYMLVLNAHTSLAQVLPLCGDIPVNNC